MQCRHAAEFITRELDEPLPLLSRAGLALHLSLCSTCRRFRAQVAVVHEVAAALIDDAEMPAPLSELSRETKERFSALIRESLGREP
jgi:predicted anti-sigma-YlaC factor YlaD